MIDEKSLRIGNWIMYKSKPYQVVGLMDGMVMIKYRCGSREWELREEFAPIPLTDEIRSKAGFDKNESHTWETIAFRENMSPIVRKFTNLSYTHKQTGFKISVLSNLNIKHLHELQNSFFFYTGNELTYTP